MKISLVYLVIFSSLSALIHVSQSTQPQAAQPQVMSLQSQVTSSQPHGKSQGMPSQPQGISQGMSSQPQDKSQGMSSQSQGMSSQPQGISQGTSSQPQDKSQGMSSQSQGMSSQPQGISQSTSSQPQGKSQGMSSQSQGISQGTSSQPQGISQGMSMQPQSKSQGMTSQPQGMSSQSQGMSSQPQVISQGMSIQPQPAQSKAALPTPPGLSVDYYAKTCPDFDRTLLEIITPKQSSTPTTAAATLRVFFHDCFVEGCDSSILVNTGSTGPTERDNPLNLDLPGDAFDVIVRVKTALEISCPGVVSCSDILAAATRHLIKQVGGPFYTVLLGKKDGLVSVASHVDHNLTDENQTFDTMLAPFLQKGFTVREMVALLGGGHTIGFAHCTKFAKRLFKFSPTAETDPSLNPAFAARLKTLCANYSTSPDMAAFLDPMSPGKFDNNYFTNILHGLDILPSDHVLLLDPRSKSLIEEYAKDQNKFFADFAQAMEKLNVLGVKTGADGEVRTNCFSFNSKI